MLRWLIPLLIFLVVFLIVDGKWKPFEAKFLKHSVQNKDHVYQGDGNQGQGHPPREMPVKYGAFATSANTFSWGSSYNYKSKDVAIDDAIARCAESGALDCKMQMWFYQGCAALAINKGSEEYRNGSWGTSRKATKEIAEKEALKFCTDFGGEGCEIVESVCVH